MSVAPESDARTGSVPTRLHFLDGLRAVLMLLGIPYHALLLFSGEPWAITSPTRTPSLSVVEEFIHQFRMPTFFAIAGLFALMILRRRGPATWFRGRVQRLGIPLLFGLILINPLQALIVDRSPYGVFTVGLDSVPHVLTDLRSLGVAHLWFLLNLLLYCGALAILYASPLRPGLSRAGRRIGEWSLTSSRTLFTALAITTVGVTVLLAGWEWSGIQSVVVGFVDADIIVYAPAFVVGVVIASKPGLVDRFSTMARGPLWAAALVSLVVIVMLNVVLDAESTLSSVARAICWTVGGLAWVMLLFGLAGRFFAAQSRWVDWLVDSSLVIYIVHQPLVLLFGSWMIGGGINPVLGAVLLTGAVLVAAAVIYEAVNATPGLRFLMTGRRERSKSLLRPEG